MICDATRWQTCRKLEKGLEIEIYEIGGPLCPVRAWRRYMKMAGNSELDLPVFRQEGGLAYSHSMFNRDLRVLFKGRVHYGAVSGHSFRIGMATLLAECGYSDEGRTVHRNDAVGVVNRVSLGCRYYGNRPMVLLVLPDLHQAATGDSREDGATYCQEGGAGRTILK